MPVALNYEEGGPHTGQVLLLIHPMGADLSFWNACRAIWQMQYRCIAVDLRNAGASPHSASPLSIEEQAADIEAFRREQAIDRLVVVGCAVGAMIASAYAGMFADRCEALVLSNPGFRTLPEARSMLAQRAADVRRGGMAAVLAGVVDSTFLDCPKDERREDFLERFASQDPIAYALQIEGMLTADTSSHLPRIICPALIVAGGNDRLLPPDHARQIHEVLPRSEYVLMKEGAHFIPYQRPDEFAGLVTRFLNG
jgi:3-oxoadipate enol-lactonase